MESIQSVPQLQLRPLYWNDFEITETRKPNVWCQVLSILIDVVTSMVSVLSRSVMNTTLTISISIHVLKKTGVLLCAGGYTVLRQKDDENFRHHKKRCQSNAGRRKIVG